MIVVFLIFIYNIRELLISVTLLLVDQKKPYHMDKIGLPHGEKATHPPPPPPIKIKKEQKGSPYNETIVLLLQRV